MTCAAFRSALATVCILSLALLAAMIFVPLANAEPQQVLRLEDEELIDLTQLMEEVKGDRLLFIGEDHLLEKNHLAQLAIISTMHEQGMDIAIGLEMFTAGRQRELDRWTAGKLSEQQFRGIYEREWNLPWPLYRDIFLYAREHHIPMIGLNVPRSLTRKVARQGFAALSPKERRKLPKGVTCTVDPTYRAMISKAFADHSLTSRQFEHFCQAQMLWNRVMARHLGDYLKRNANTTAVVLAGVGHAMKGGIPEEIREQGHGMKVLLPELPALAMGKVTTAEADYLLLFSHLESKGAR